MNWYRLLCIMFLPLLITGCSTKNEIIPVLTKISFTAQIDYYNENYSCNTNIDDNGVMTVEVISPESIEGMLITFTDSEISAQYKGITYTPKTESMPIGSVTQLMYDIFDDVSKTVETVSAGEENCVIKGKADGREYSFTFSPAGLPLVLEIPNDSFKITFENVTINNLTKTG